MKSPFLRRFGMPSPFFDNETGFSPSVLFALAEPGVWYDPSDLTTLFQDTAGTTPVTTPGQTVGLVLDKSQGAVGTNGASRRNLLTFTEQFDNAAWTKTSSTVTANADTAPDGTLTADALIEDGSTANHLVQLSPSLASSTYTASVYVKPKDGRRYCLLYVVGFNGGQYFDLQGAGAVLGTQGNAPTSPTISAQANGYFRISFTFTGQATIFQVYTSDNGTRFSGFAGSAGSGLFIWGAQLETGSTATNYQRITTDWSSTMAGFHATQGTAASRPTYGVVPQGGRRNLLTWTEQFDNAAWTKTAATVTANAATAPDGTTSADLLVVTTATSTHAVDDSVLWQATSGTSYTVSVFVKKPASNSARYFQMTFGSGFFGATQYATYDLDTGTVSGSAVGTASISDRGNGWFRCVFTAPATGSGAGEVFFSLSNAATGRLPSYTGNGTDSILIWGAQLETGSSATSYQKVTTAFDVTEAGVPSLSYLSFDGVDDFMVTPTITPGIDKAQVFAGVRKLSDAATGVVAEHSANINTNAGTFGVFAPVSAGSNYSFASRGSSTVAFADATGFAAPISNVLTGLGDISGDRETLRVNGSQVAQITADQGTGNYLAYPLYIGRRGGTTLPFNGNIFSLIVRFGANLDAATIAATETWVNSKTGAY